MLVVNTAFQRFALIEQDVMAIESTPGTMMRGSPDFVETPDWTIDDLDSHPGFWTFIPNTLLVQIDTESSEFPTGTRPRMEYVVSAQERYIDFFRSIYYLAANVEIPSPDLRSSLPFPRELQRVPPGLPSTGWNEVFNTYGEGTPTPIPPPSSLSSPESYLVERGTLGKAPSIVSDHEEGATGTGTRTRMRVKAGPTRRMERVMIKADAANVSRAGEKKHEYAALRQAARQVGKGKAEIWARISSSSSSKWGGGQGGSGGRRDGDAGGPEGPGQDGNLDDGRPWSGSGSGGDTHHDQAGGPSSGQGEGGSENTQSSDSNAGEATGTTNLALACDSDHQQHARLSFFDPILYANNTFTERETETASTPSLSPSINTVPSSSTFTSPSPPPRDDPGDGSTILTSLESIRNLVHKSGVRIKLVDPVEMDRIVGGIVRGSELRTRKVRMDPESTVSKRHTNPIAEIQIVTSEAW